MPYNLGLLARFAKYGKILRPSTRQHKGNRMQNDTPHLQLTPAVNGPKVSRLCDYKHDGYSMMPTRMEVIMLACI